MTRELRDFTPVEFERGEWKSFDTYATDFLSNTAALPGTVVGAFARIRASFVAYGNGWSLRASWDAWSTFAGTVDRSALEAALSELEGRGVLIVDRRDVEVTIADPAMHADLLRKQRARERKEDYRERHGARQSGTSRETSRGKSRVKSRGTSVLPPSSFPLPSSSSETGTDAAPSEPCPARNDSTESSSRPASTDPASCLSRAQTRRRPHPEWGAAGKVLDHYARKHPDYRPDAAGRRLVIARFGDGYSVEDLRVAIDGAHLSPWHSGTDPKRNGATALSLGVILGTSDQITKFIEIAEAGPRTVPTPGGTSDYLVG